MAVMVTLKDRERERERERGLKFRIVCRKLFFILYTCDC